MLCKTFFEFIPQIPSSSFKPSLSLAFRSFLHFLFPSGGSTPLLFCSLPGLLTSSCLLRFPSPPLMQMGSALGARQEEAVCRSGQSRASPLKLTPYLREITEDTDPKQIISKEAFKLI